MKSRLIVLATAVVMAAGTGGAIALTSGHAGNAAVAQYGCAPAQIVPAAGCGQNGANGQNGFNGANGQNGVPGTTTITITIPVTTPLPGTAKPTATHHKLIRVCKRYSHYSAKFHRTFHPKVCWARYV